MIRRVPVVWGTSERIADRPGLTHLTDALYRPGDATRPPQVVAEPAPAGTATAPQALYLVLDLMTAHYGHFIADVLARLWPIVAPEVEGAAGPVRIVTPPGQGPALWRAHPFIGEILGGLGLSVDAVVAFDTDTILPHAVVAEPAFHNLRCWHPAFQALCRRAGASYWRADEVDTVARPAYLAKSRLASGMHRLVNEGALTAELERRGIEILYPETMRFSEQVRLFARRRVLMGPVGSAFHTAAFSAPGRRTIGLSGMMHLNSNYLMFDAMNGARAYYYHVPGTRLGEADGFGLAWTIPDPKGVAVAMLRRAEAFDRIEAIDAAALAPRRGVAGWLGRLRARIAPGRGPAQGAPPE